MSDHDFGKREIERMVFDQILDAFPYITARTVTDDGEEGFAQVEGSPDFVIGLDGEATGIEISEVRSASDAWSYLEQASRIAWKKHES
jgi:hypothetical protein